jgi:hypothetical protein
MRHIIALFAIPAVYFYNNDWAWFVPYLYIPRLVTILLLASLMGHLYFYLENGGDPKKYALQVSFPKFSESERFALNRSGGFKLTLKKAILVCYDTAALSVVLFYLDAVVLGSIFAISAVLTIAMEFFTLQILQRILETKK